MRTVSETISLKDTPKGEVSKYITKISNIGITVHPEVLATNSNYLQLDGNGLRIKNFTNTNNDSTLASFLADGITLGNNDGSQSYLYLDYHSLQMIDKEDNTYFYASDLRDAEGYYTDYYVGDGNTTNFYFTYRIGYTSLGSYVPDISKIIEVKIDGIVQSSSTYSVPSVRYIRFNSSPSDGADIEVKYIPTNELGDYDQSRFWTTKAYTLGRRDILSSSILNPIGPMSVVEGLNNMASGDNSHAEGNETLASGEDSHTEGRGTRASGDYSHAEGWTTNATGSDSHAEGFASSATGAHSHAEGGPNALSSGELISTTASGAASHAEGWGTEASGDGSHSQNLMTIAAKSSQTALGTYNIQDTASTTTHPNGIAAYGQFAIIVGNGTHNARSNALTVDWGGRVDINNVPSVASNDEAYIKIRHSSIDSDGATPTATVYSNNLHAFDVDGTRIGYSESWHNTNDVIGHSLGASRKVNGTMYYNSITPWVDANGGYGYSLTSPYAFKKVLKLEDAFDINAVPSTARNITIGATTNASDHFSVKRTGWKAIACCGWNLNNQASGGQNVSLCVPYSMFLNTQEEFYYEIRNTASSQAKITLQVYILYVKVTY